MLREKKKQEQEEEQRKKKALAAEKRALAAEKRTQAEEKKAQAAAKKAEKEAKKANPEMDKSGRKRSGQSHDHVSTRSRVDEVPTTTAEAENVCCVCFQCYLGDQEDSEWVQCACKRWLHEGCITDIEYDVYGRELFCPYCYM